MAGGADVKAKFIELMGTFKENMCKALCPELSTGTCVSLIDWLVSDGICKCLKAEGQN